MCPVLQLLLHAAKSCVVAPLAGCREPSLYARQLRLLTCRPLMRQVPLSLADTLGSLLLPKLRLADLQSLACVCRETKHMVLSAETASWSAAAAQDGLPGFSHAAHPYSTAAWLARQHAAIMAGVCSSHIIEGYSSMVGSSLEPIALQPDFARAVTDGPDVGSFQTVPCLSAAGNSTHAPLQTVPPDEPGHIRMMPCMDYYAAESSCAPDGSHFICQFYNGQSDQLARDDRVSMRLYNVASGSFVRIEAGPVLDILRVLWAPDSTAFAVYSVSSKDPAKVAAKCMVFEVPGRSDSHRNSLQGWHLSSSAPFRSTVWSPCSTYMALCTARCLKVASVKDRRLLDQRDYECRLEAVSWSTMNGQLMLTLAASPRKRQPGMAGMAESVSHIHHFQPGSCSAGPPRMSGPIPGRLQSLGACAVSMDSSDRLIFTQLKFNDLGASVLSACTLKFGFRVAWSPAGSIWLAVILWERVDVRPTSLVLYVVDSRSGRIACQVEVPGKADYIEPLSLVWASNGCAIAVLFRDVETHRRQRTFYRFGMSMAAPAPMVSGP